MNFKMMKIIMFFHMVCLHDMSEIFRPYLKPWNNFAVEPHYLLQTSPKLFANFT
jgi:hypothetical protein